MHGEPRVVCQPRPHPRVLMSAVVVCDDMHIQFSRDALVDLLEKGKELLVTMPGFAVGQNGTVCHIQGCKQGCRAMPQVVVGNALYIPQAHGQYRLGTLKRLDLRLLIYA